MRVITRVSIVLGVCLTLGFSLNACSRSQRSETTSSNPQSNPQPEATAPTPTASFKAVIENVSMYPVPNNRQDLAVTLVVSMTNSGQSSIAKSWTLEVDSLDPSLPSGLSPVHINGIVDLPGSGGTKVDLGKEDLAQKTTESAVGTNAKVNGVLTFVLPKTSSSELSNNNTSLVLHFRDSHGNAYQTEKTLIGKQVSTTTR